MHCIKNKKIKLYQEYGLLHAAGEQWSLEIMCKSNDLTWIQIMCDQQTNSSQNMKLSP